MNDSYPLLTEEHLRIPLVLANKRARQRSPRHDRMVSEGYLALLLAYRTYDGGSGASLTTHLYGCVSRRIEGYGQHGRFGSVQDSNWKRTGGLVVRDSRDGGWEPLDVAAPEQSDRVADRDAAEWLFRRLNLNAEYRDLAVKRWMCGWTEKELAAELGVTPQAVGKKLRKIQGKAARLAASLENDV